jgi:hypothetical protein
MPAQKVRPGYLARLGLGKKLELVAASVLFAAIIGVAVLRGMNTPPSVGGHNGSAVTESRYISREKAIDSALKRVDTATLEVKESGLNEKFSVYGKELAVWRVSFQTKDEQKPQVTYFVDALTGEIFWSENPPGQGAMGSNFSARLQQYTPVKLALIDYRGVSRNLGANPDDAVAALSKATRQDHRCSYHGLRWHRQPLKTKTGMPSES